MKYLRKVKGVTRIYRIRNEAVRQELEALIDHIESKQLRDGRKHTNKTNMGSESARKKEKR
nr:unnamed protein product [Callosobruchus chinensis]